MYHELTVWSGGIIMDMEARGVSSCVAAAARKARPAAARWPVLRSGTPGGAVGWCSAAAQARTTPACRSPPPDQDQGTGALHATEER